MAKTIKCRSCRKNVSSEAFSCPHCGDPYITEKRKKEDGQKKKKAELLQKFKYIDQLTKNFASPTYIMACPACGKVKRSRFYFNLSGVYYEPSCDCTMDDICKSQYGITLLELKKELGWLK